jgi:hypothetical protein
MWPGNPAILIPCNFGVVIHCLRAPQHQCSIVPLFHLTPCDLGLLWLRETGRKGGNRYPATRFFFHTNVAFVTQFAVVALPLECFQGLL